MFSVYSQYVDTENGFHVIELRDGKRQHLIQIAIGADSCPACGHVKAKDGLGELDPKAVIASTCEELNLSRATMSSYAKKHGITEVR